MSERIRISQPVLGDDVEALVLQVLRSGHLAQGTMVERFEAQCAAMAGTRHAVAVANGTVALQAALDAAGVRDGDEVITSPLTFAATLNAILRRGSVARFADITDDFTIDPDSVRPLINERTRVLLPVHLYGLMADMDALAAIADENGLRIVEDAAQAHGATQGARHAGGTGIGSFSFYATKNVTSGEGGAVTSDDLEVTERVRLLRNQGMRSRYDYESIGENWRMTDVAAAIAIPQMQRLEQIIEQRNQHARMLSDLLSVDPRITLPRIPPGRAHVWHQYTVLLPAECDRDAVVQHMHAAGVEAGVYYPRLVWDHSAYRQHAGVRIDASPRAAAVVARCLSLPVHPSLTDEDISRVATTLLHALKR